MRKQRKSSKKESGSLGTQALFCIRAAMLSCIVTAVMILVLALLLKWSLVPLSSVRLINTIIKSICACTAGFLCARRISRRAYLFGGLGGMLYIVMAYLIFALIERSFSLDWHMVSDLALGFACGTGTAIICRLAQDLREQAS